MTHLSSNIGALDKSIRITLVFTAIAIYTIKIVENSSNYIFVIVAGILALTALSRHCPLYTIWGISTLEHKEIE